MGNHCVCIQDDAAPSDDEELATKRDRRQQKVLAGGKRNPGCVKAILNDISTGKQSIPCVGGASWAFRSGSGQRGNLTGGDLQQIAARLCDGSAAHSVTRLELVSRGFDDAAAAALSGVVASRSCRSLTYLSISHNNLTDEGVGRVFTSLLESSNTTLKTLLVDGNAVAGGCLGIVGEVLEANKGLEHLELCVGAGDVHPAPSADFRPLFKGVAKNRSLTKFKLSGENARSRKGTAVERIMSVADFGAFFSKLADCENTTLTDLALTYLLAEAPPSTGAPPSKGDADEARTPSHAYATLAATLLSSTTRLVSLDLSGNMMGDGVASPLAEALRSPGCTLASLNLARNSLSSQGLAALAPGLGANKSLKRLDLSHQNALRQAHAPPLGKKNSSEPTHTSVGSAQCLDEGYCAVFVALQSNAALEAIMMVDVYLTPTVAAAVLACLSTNRSVNDIRHGGCGGDVEAELSARLTANNEYTSVAAVAGAASAMSLSGSEARPGEGGDRPQLVFRDEGSNGSPRHEKDAPAMPATDDPSAYDIDAYEDPVAIDV